MPAAAIVVAKRTLGTEWRLIPTHKLYQFVSIRIEGKIAMNIHSLLNPLPIPPAQPERAPDASSRRQSVDAPERSAVDNGKQRATPISREERAAVMTAQDRGAKHRLSRSPSGSEPKQLRVAGDDRYISPAAPHQNASLSSRQAVPESTTAGGRAFTAARPALPPLTSLQGRQLHPLLASRTLPSSPQPSAHTAQAPVPWQAAQNEANRPSCYQDMNHWKQSVKQMVQAKRDSRRLYYTGEEKAAIVELFEASGMRKTAFGLEVLNDKKGGAILHIIMSANQMKTNGTLPAPWRPSLQNETNIPSCYWNMGHWKESVKQMVQAKRASRRLFYTDAEKAAIAELFEAAGMRKTAFSLEVLNDKKGGAILHIITSTNEMKTKGTLPAPWRPLPNPAPQNPAA